MRGRGKGRGREERKGEGGEGIRKWRPTLRQCLGLLVLLSYTRKEEERRGREGGRENVSLAYMCHLQSSCYSQSGHTLLWSSHP